MEICKDCDGLKPDKSDFRYWLRLCRNLHYNRSCTPPTCFLFSEYEHRICPNYLTSVLRTIPVQSYPQKNRLFKRLGRVSLDLNTFFE